MDYDGDGLGKKDGSYGDQKNFCSNNVPDDLTPPEKWVLTEGDDCPTLKDAVLDECLVCNGPGRQTYYYDDDGDGYGSASGSKSFQDFCPNSIEDHYVDNNDDECPYNAGIFKDPKNFGYDCDGKIVADIEPWDPYPNKIGPHLQAGILFYKDNAPGKTPYGNPNSEEDDLVKSPYFQIGYIAEYELVQNPSVISEEDINQKLSFYKAKKACEGRIKEGVISSNETKTYKDWFLPDTVMLKSMNNIFYIHDDKWSIFSYGSNYGYFWSTTDGDYDFGNNSPTKKIFSSYFGLGEGNYYYDRPHHTKHHYIPIHKVGPTGPLDKYYAH